VKPIKLDGNQVLVTKGGDKKEEPKKEDLKKEKIDGSKKVEEY
jgi:hypothetical protein